MLLSCFPSNTNTTDDTPPINETAYLRVYAPNGVACEAQVALIEGVAISIPFNTYGYGFYGYYTEENGNSLGDYEYDTDIYAYAYYLDSE